MGLRPVRRLTSSDDLSGFDSSETDLDQWLRRYALSDQNASVSVTYVLSSDDDVVGFYTIAPHAIEASDAGLGRLGKGFPRSRAIPVFLLARLALDKSVQGSGLGGDLLTDALLRCLGAAEEYGGRAVVVHAKHKQAAAFYRRYGFLPLPQNELHLYLLMKDIEKSLVDGTKNSVT